MQTITLTMQSTHLCVETSPALFLYIHYSNFRSISVWIKAGITGNWLLTKGNKIFYDT